jgi:hypothetical protein
MVPQPKKQMPQRQPLTVALRKICRDYPAGDGILKELLQNADDAGASTVVRLTLCSPSFIDMLTVAEIHLRHKHSSKLAPTRGWAFRIPGAGFAGLQRCPFQPKGL